MQKKNCLEIVAAYFFRNKGWKDAKCRRRFARHLSNRREIMQTDYNFA